MPSPDEKRALDIPEGVPVAELHTASGVRLFVGDRDELYTPNA